MYRTGSLTLALGGGGDFYGGSSGCFLIKRTPKLYEEACDIDWLTHRGLMTPYGDIDLGQLTAPIHYLNQCWLIISEAQSQSYLDNFSRDNLTINH